MARGHLLAVMWFGLERLGRERVWELPYDRLVPRPKSVLHGLKKLVWESQVGHCLKSLGWCGDWCLSLFPARLQLWATWLSPWKRHLAVGRE